MALFYLNQDDSGDEFEPEDEEDDDGDDEDENDDEDRVHNKISVL